MNIKYSKSKYYPQIYIACYAAYEQEFSYGEYADATDENKINETIKRVIATSPAIDPEDYMIRGFKDFGGLYFFDEHPPIDQVVELANFIKNYSSLGINLMHYYIAQIKEIRYAWLEVRSYDELGNIYDIISGIKKQRIESNLERDLINCINFLMAYVW